MPSPVEPYHILTFCKKKLCGKNHEFRKILIPYFIFFLHKYFLQKVKVQAFSKSKWTGLETTCSLFSLKLYTCNHANLWLPLLFFLFLSCSIFIIAASLLLITFFDRLKNAWQISSQVVSSKVLCEANPRIPYNYDYYRISPYGFI